MRHVFHEEKSKLKEITIRLLRCRDQTMRPGPDGEKVLAKVGPCRNEITASFWDEKRTKYRDFIRMIVADTLPEAMPQFLSMSIKEISRLLPKYKNVDKVERKDCRTVYSYEQFAEALQRR